ncbi:MAG: hypothetical protein EAZ91_04970 [Cytophagales bacterium]|nr:MAG: hypothetical protein EAZ91_04970 [Cytophagales bacterium]
MTPTQLKQKEGLLLDANLLVLYVLGCYDPKRIVQNKRTSTYTEEDFGLLINFMGLFKLYVTTPNILTEVSNLLEGVKYQYGPVLALLPQLVEGFVEIYEPSFDVMKQKETAFLKFGLGDAVSYGLAEQDYLVLTDDLSLCYMLQSRGLDALNFNHLRSDYLLR